jgi:ABC-type multidrug transport system ATPase subunit/CRP-like cAMP-binding protein
VRARGPSPRKGSTVQDGIDASNVATQTVRLPAVDDEQAYRLRFLYRVDLFHHAAPATLEAVAAALKPRDVPAGAIVCREDDPADDFYLIETGTLLVTTGDGDEAFELGRMGAGDFFGEVALLGGGRRTATVRAETAAQLWVLARVAFEGLVEREPSLESALRQVARRRELNSQMHAFEVEHRNLATLTSDQGEIRIGRATDNDLVFASRLVSRHHAVLERQGDTFRLRDLNSGNGTYVNGEEIGTAVLADGDEIWIADERLVFDRREIHRLVEPRGVRIDVAELTTVVKGGKKLLNGISLSILFGEFVAIVGGSGAGKSTFMDAISGVRPATSGSVRYNGRDYYRDMALFRNSLGYVPQDDIIHVDLKVRRVLQYAAQLRLPSDTSRSDRDAAVDEVIEQLGLVNQKDVRVSALSGGQRKRTSIGVELLTRPRIFFLDEPTSGLDPATDTQMMRLLRRLADDGSTVVLTTHATKNVAMCDKVIILARGGYLAFVGTPEQALRYFEVEAFDQIYDKLSDEATPEEWAERFAASPEYAEQNRNREAVTETAASARSLASGGRRRSPFRQLAVLTRRNFDLTTATRRDVAVFFTQPIIIALLMLAVFRIHPFRLGVDNPRIPLVVLFFLISTGIFFGISNAIREIVKEYPIFRRERMVNLSIVPYVSSKAVVIAPILVVQEVLMVAVLFAAQRLPERGLSVYGPLLLTICLNAFAAMAMGLFVSAVVSNADQASRLVPMLLIPQLLFSGAILSVPAMGVVGQAISRVMISKWAFDALGHVADLNGLFKHGTSPLAAAMLRDYGETFNAQIVVNWGVLIGFIFGFLALACFALYRKSARR